LIVRIPLTRRTAAKTVQPITAWTKRIGYEFRRPPGAATGAAIAATWPAPALAATCGTADRAAAADRVGVVAGHTATGPP
jgi:FtsP/CotA-like multicopper oxidase with cupredoxin domain